MKAQTSRFGRLLCFVLAISLLPFSACKKDDPVDPSTADCRQGVYDIVKEWYLWKEELPQNFNPADYETAAEVMEALRYKADDRWSSVSDLEAYQQFFEQGKFAGLGIGLHYDQDDNIWITYAYADSPAGRAGVQRGWRVSQIDGVAVSAISDVNDAFGPSDVGYAIQLTFLKDDGSEETFDLVKEEVSINTVLHREVIQTAVGKTGYLVFKNFIETSRTELDQAFADFQSEGIDELILDLRYNGGGRVDVATLLSGYIVPVGADNQVLIQYLHNEDKKSENSSVLMNKQGGLEFNRLVILTTQGTASASELMINGLRPYLEVVTIGSATHGKPVGSYGFQCGGEFAVSPIAFRVANADGVTDYFEGIAEDFSSSDDLTRRFGDPAETMLQSAIEFLETGAVTGSLGRAAKTYGQGASEIFVRPELPELNSY